MNMDVDKIQEEIRSCIATGTVIYNAGDHRACERMYRGLADEIIHKTRVIKEARIQQIRGKLKAAIVEVEKRAYRDVASQNAWTYRNCFDSILEMSSGGPKGRFGGENNNVMAGPSARDMEDYSRANGQTCRNPGNCAQPNCDCYAQRGERPIKVAHHDHHGGALPHGCENPFACSFPKCSCVRIRWCLGHYFVILWVEVIKEYEKHRFHA